MKLPIPFFNKNKQNESAYYLALLLTDEKASAVILQETFGKLEIIGKHEEFFPASIETLRQEELITLVDKTISRAEEVLPPDLETHKTVFGVKEDWVETETKKIKKDYLAKLKKVCDNLDLTPIGFMVVTEAISNLLQEEEGAPLSAILAEVGKETASLALYRGGKVVERIHGPLTESAPKTVDTLLKHFTTAVLPARIILFDAKEAEKLSQQFIGHQWSKSLPFLHVPQITVLPAGFDAKAVTFGAATQMGFELSGMNNKTALEPLPDTPLSLTEENDTKEPEEEKMLEEKDEGLHEEAPESHEASPSLISSDNFGFVMGEDIASLLPQKNEQKHPDDAEPFHSNLHHATKEQEDIEDERQTKSKLPGLGSLLGRIQLPKMKLPLLSLGQGKGFLMPVILLVGLLVVGGFLTYFYFYHMQAHIVLSVKPKMVDQTANVVFSATSPSDFSKNIIAAKTIAISVDGSISTDATGKKDIGNKAKGTVTLYNNDSTDTSLDNGTAIKSSTGLVFLLDKSVTVSGASGDVFSGTKPGTADVTVTAKDIGPDSNLPSGTKFSIGTNSSLAAKNDSAFSGGSKKQATVVSRNDITKLKTDLPTSLQSKAKDMINQKVSGDETLLPLLNTVSLDKTKFDKNVDDEAKTVNLTASVSFEGLAYQNDELNNYAKTLLKDRYTQTISFADNSIKNTLKDTKQTKNGAVNATVDIQAGLLPNINTDDVAHQVQGKSLSQTKKFLTGLPQVADSQITFSPAIPLLPNLFPRLPKNVTVEIKPE